MKPDERSEWIEPDGLGGFASGTSTGVRTRRYHALLLSATTPPTGRFVLVNGVEVFVNTPSGTYPLSSQRYAPGVVHPGGAELLTGFEPRPWPAWTYRLPDGTEVAHELFVARRHGGPVTVMTWRAVKARGRVKLMVRPFLSGRDYHAMHHENSGFRFDPAVQGDRFTWRPYPGVPGVTVCCNGRYRHEPVWYRNFQYDLERARGLDFTEDLAAPGEFTFDLDESEGVLILAAESGLGGDVPGPGMVGELRRSELNRRTALGDGLSRAGDDYLVQRGTGLTVVAGYPWFTDWGRDTFIALRGLCLATGRLDDARRILVEWASTVSRGMLPNRFPDAGGAPEYNAVDASLWYVVAVHEYLAAAGNGAPAKDRAAMKTAVLAIVSGYAAGTRYGIRGDRDGLLAAGEPGVQLTWMDAKVGDWVVTPRIGKPVEVQALWVNALRAAGQLEPRWCDLADRAAESFRSRFWDESRGQLHDVVDVDHVLGKVDASCRPNQVLAIGGLPWAVLDGERARRVVGTVESRLLTPMGLRSLAPDEPGYCSKYDGGPLERDGAYHNGTVWPWLMGPFVEAWVRVRGGTVAAKAEARSRFLTRLLETGGSVGLGHLPEVADGDPPHRPGGCPFQAWSVSEAMRLDRVVLGVDRAGASGDSAGSRPPVAGVKKKDQTPKDPVDTLRHA
jgi:predicted glycogen debranching enzyme